MWKGYLEQTDLLELIKFSNSSFEKEDRLEWINSQESVWHFSVTKVACGTQHYLKKKQI